MVDMNDALNTDAFADRLTDRQIKLLGQVSLQMTGGPRAELSFDEWTEAEALFDQIDADEAV